MRVEELEAVVDRSGLVHPPFNQQVIRAGRLQSSQHIAHIGLAKGHAAPRINEAPVGAVAALAQQIKQHAVASTCLDAIQLRFATAIAKRGRDGIAEYDGGSAGQVQQPEGIVADSIAVRVDVQDVIPCHEIQQWVATEVARIAAIEIARAHDRTVRTVQRPLEGAVGQGVEIKLGISRQREGVVVLLTWVGNRRLHGIAEGQRGVHIDHWLHVEAVTDIAAAVSPTFDHQRVGAGVRQRLYIDIAVRHVVGAPHRATEWIDQPPERVAAVSTLQIKIEALACRDIKTVEIGLPGGA